MKILFLFLALICAAVLSMTPATVSKAASQKHRATAKFDVPVMLRGAVLKGEYLFVHDDAAMARGETCTYVYKGVAEVKDKLVASFHCNPIDRDKASHFTWRTAEVSPGIYELREFQFNGETEGHMVPTIAK